jgi:ribosomal protein S27E
LYDFRTRQANVGNRVAYRSHEVNHCPDCGKSQWMIGRLTAECAYCATALPLLVGGSTGISALRRPPYIAPLAA